MSIRDVRASDAPRIAAIYNHYVRETVVTFEEQPVAEAEMARRIADTTAAYPWLVWEDGGTVAAYAYASSWKRRSAYRFAAESTIYAAPRGQRTGHRLAALPGPDRTHAGGGPALRDRRDLAAESRKRRVA